MNFTCQNCHTLITIVPGERPPPWCSKCGADFKPDDHRFAVLFESPRDERPPPPSSPPRPPAGRSRPVLPAQPAAPVAEVAEEPAAEPEAREAAPAKRPDRAAGGAPDSAFGLKLLAAAGAVCLAVGIMMAVQKSEWVRGCGAAAGVVVLPEGKGTPVVRYTVGGRDYELVQPDTSPGTVIPILYREDQPNEAVVHDTFALYRLPGIIALLGVGALVTAGSGFALRSGAGKKEAAPRAR